MLGRGRQQPSSRWWYLSCAWRAERMQVVERQGGWKGKGERSRGAAVGSVSRLQEAGSTSKAVWSELGSVGEEGE